MAAIDEAVGREEHVGRLRFETLLAELSAHFINLPSVELDAGIEDALRRVCESFGFDVAVLWQWENDSPEVFTLTHHYRCLDGPPLTRQLQASESFPWCLREVQAGRSVIIPSLDDAPEGAELDQASLRHFGARNAFIFPLCVSGTPFGALTVHDMLATRPYPVDRDRQMELVTLLFANAILRMRTDQALRESEERASLATEAAGAGTWVLDSQGTAFWVGEKLMEMLGLPPAKRLEVGRFMDLVHPDDRQAVRDAMNEACCSREMRVVEYRLVRPDGQVRWMQSRGRLHGTSATARFMGITSDITQRQDNDSNLRESEARVAAAIDVARLGCYEVLNGIRVTSTNRRAREILGWSDDIETSGRILEFWLEHVHPEDRPAVMEVRRVMESEERDRITLDYRFLHPERGVVHIHHLAHVLERDSSGQAVRTIGVLEDVTEQKRVEAEVAGQRMQLAHVSRVSTISQLASSLAHELNQPLGAILRNAEAAELLLQDPSPDLEEVQAILADIRADDQRAGSVIDHMRALMRRRADDFLPLDLCTLASDVVSLLRHDADMRGVRLKQEPCPPLPLACGDSVQLQQVILNLLLNAMDAVSTRPEGNRLVTLTACQAGESVQLAVRDNGCGIPPDSLQQIFEPFITTKSDGLGMGLAISQTILKAHKGTLRGENNPDGGATFTITLPVADEGRGTGDEGRGARGGHESAIT